MFLLILQKWLKKIQNDFLTTTVLYKEYRDEPPSAIIPGYRNLHGGWSNMSYDWLFWEFPRSGYCCNQLVKHSYRHGIWYDDRGHAHEQMLLHPFTADHCLDHSNSSNVTETKNPCQTYANGRSKSQNVNNQVGRAIHCNSSVTCYSSEFT